MSLVKGLLLWVLLIGCVDRRFNCDAKWIETQSDRPEVDVKDAQNTASCKYTVEQVTEHSGWLFKQLYHIRCKNSGVQCSGPDKHRNYTCLQTVKEITVFKTKPTQMTLYTGCVCAYKLENRTGIFNDID